jgi:hypothetical protein
MITKITALLSIKPNAQWSWTGENYSDLEWLDILQTKPSENEINKEFNRLKLEEPKQNCKSKSQLLLNESDFADLYSVRNKLENINEWDNYREIIRELRINPIENPVFPDKPQTIWKES